MLRGLTIVLVRPRFPENIGMVARAMANMGASDLALVAPERLDPGRSASLATPQGRAILDAARVLESLDEALTSCVAAFGTTARTGGRRQDVLAPERAALEIRGLLRGYGRLARDAGREGADQEKEGRVALVFGSEDRGLLNSEVDLCTRLVHIPAIVGNTSLNLAQAVLIVLYECARPFRTRTMCDPDAPAGEAAGDGPGNLSEPRDGCGSGMADPVDALVFLESSAGEARETRSWTRPLFRRSSRRVSLREEELLLRTLEEMLVGVGHLPSGNSGWFLLPMRRFLRKSRLRRHEFDALMGICRQIRHKLKV